MKTLVLFIKQMTPFEIALVIYVLFKIMSNN